jgi:hypothetical protein
MAYKAVYKTSGGKSKTAVGKIINFFAKLHEAL